jgi:hypothetical protein
VSRTKIDALTPEQEQSLAAYREDWLRVGRSCEPANRAEAERVFVAMYAALGKPAPKVWWCDGPATGSLVRAIFKANLRDNLWVNLRVNLEANLGDNLRDNLGANLWANLGDNLRDNLWDNLRDNVYWSFRGRHEAYWPAYYSWPDMAIRPMHTEKQRERLGWWLTLARSCGWWQPYENIVFACEPPSKQSVDENGRLHCADGPAMVCRDGWEVYAWHNVRVERAVIMDDPATWTLADIMAEQNAEVRRVKLERFGGERLRDHATLRQQDDTGRLYELAVPGDDEPCVFVDVENSTPEPDGTFKRYCLMVPPTTRTCTEGVAWTFGLSPTEYVLAAQT